ncbi:unnamed protein product [Lactuca saligna]|uniref:Uncharacterized protein n=1 Tax=Lactuca saligna TaxID=75948 RepID=A0AA35ZFJ8_LACSI|nr:unnamed protein product [Lactuca saligna]
MKPKVLLLPPATIRFGNLHHLKPNLYMTLMPEQDLQHIEDEKRTSLILSTVMGKTMNTVQLVSCTTTENTTPLSELPDLCRNHRTVIGITENGIVITKRYLFTFSRSGCSQPSSLVHHIRPPLLLPPSETMSIYLFSPARRFLDLKGAEPQTESDLADLDVIYALKESDGLEVNKLILRGVR